MASTIFLRLVRSIATTILIGLLFPLPVTATQIPVEEDGATPTGAAHAGFNPSSPGSENKHAAIAQSSNEIARLVGQVSIDGYVSDDEWQGVSALPVVMYQPVFRGEMTERTEIRIGHDDTNLYVSAIMFDSEPERIMAGSLTRDGGSSADDYLNVVIDPFNDNENALWFYTTPAGLRGDMAVSNDASYFNSVNDSWNGFWSVATRRTNEGWVAEIRIPFSTLGFQGSGELVEMGLAVSRLIARKSERHVYPDIPPDWAMGFAKPSRFEDMLLRDITLDKPVYVTPYVRGGLNRLPVLDESTSRYDTPIESDREVGLDMRYNLTSNLIADVTVNTDFAEVEADNQQINLTRFSLFFPEKRQFFQERASLFEYSLGDQDRLFHSRRIGLSEGRPLRVYGGGRVVGRVGDWDVGAMSLQVDAAGEARSENFTIVRSRKQVLNPWSWVGGIWTSRVDEAGQFNVAVGLDGLFRVRADDYLTVRVAQTADDRLTSTIGGGFQQNGFAQIQLERRRQQGFNYITWIKNWQEDFVPRTGFYRLTDFTESAARIAWNWLPETAARWRSAEAAAYAKMSVDHKSGLVVTGTWGLTGEIESSSGAPVEAELVSSFERLEVPLMLPDGATVPAGPHEWLEATIVAQTAQGRAFRLGGTIGYGSFYDGFRSRLAIAPVWIASRHLEFNPIYLLDRVRFSVRDEGFNAHILRLRVNAAVDARLSASGIIQLNSADDALAINARVRYNIRERNDLWIVYDEGLNLERTALTPSLPVSSGRRILIKYTHTFAL